MADSKAIFQPFLNRRFAVSYLITMAFLATLYLIHLNKNSLFIVLIILLSLSLYLDSNKKSGQYALGILSGIACIVILYYLYQSWSTFHDIVEWDFLAFYVYGKAGADGLAFYDPASFTHILAAIHMPYAVTSEFNASIIQVGFCYPPTTMLMLAPIGFLDLNTANIVWRIFVLSFLVIDMILLYRIFRISESRWFQVMLVVALTMTLPGSSTTVALSQTNFFLLFFILLIYKEPDNWKAGMFLALAIIVKPIAAVWFLYFLINRKWKPILSFAVTGVLIVGISIVWFGFDNFLTFFTSPPTSRIPGAVYTETINQSMNAVFSRISMQIGMDSLFSQVNKIVIVISLILVIFTCIASYKLVKTNPKASFLIFLPLSLLIYPGCLMHYAVLLMPLFFFIITQRDNTRLLFFLVFMLILCVSSFAACLAILIVLILYSFSRFSVFSPLRIN